MQIKILNGIYTDNNADFRASLPHNLMPVAYESGISNGYLRPCSGVTAFGSQVFSGIDRGGTNFLDSHYRVNGNKLYKIFDDGTYVDIGSVGGGNQKCSLVYSFTHLAIASAGNLYLWDESTFGQVTDTDLGIVKDVIFIDGYFMTTDGEYLVVTDLGDPYSITNTLYEGSIVDPDPIVAIEKIRNEVYAINRYTIEAFYNAGNPGEIPIFPFKRIEGSRIMKGAVGTHAVCEFMGMLAFLGGDQKEAPSLYMGINSNANKIASREIDTILQNYTELELSETILETRIDRDYQHLWVHLPDIILVFDFGLTQKLGSPIWFTMDSGIKNIYWAYDRWLCGDDAGHIGYLDDSVSTRFGEKLDWQFDTQLTYNESRSAIVHDLELVTLSGRTILGIDPTIFMSYSNDGITWSDERMAKAGLIGERDKRIAWRRNGMFKQFRINRFRGNSDTFASFVRLEAQLEGLAH